VELAGLRSRWLRRHRAGARRIRPVPALALACAALSALAAVAPVLGFVFGLPALALGLLELRRSRRSRAALVAAASAAMGAYAVAVGSLALADGLRSEGANDDVPPTAQPPPGGAGNGDEGTDTGPLLLIVLSPVVGLVGAGGGALVTRRERRASRHLRDALRRFVPEAVADELLRTPGAELSLGGIQTDGTVMFTDIRGFTTFSESRPASDVIGVLNRYLTEMTDAVLDHGGTLVSYAGDGIMAVFGAPVRQDDHADRALAAAREILERRLPRFNAWLGTQGVADGFRIGVGVNSGPFVSGNVGSERRLEYTAIGDTINAAARLEELTKDTQHALLLSDAARRSLRRPAEDLVYVGAFELRGRRQRTEVWSVVSSSSAPS
jgi:class 3 adenylate cyclase